MSKIEQAESILRAKLQEWSSDSDNDDDRETEKTRTKSSRHVDALTPATTTMVKASSTNSSSSKKQQHNKKHDKAPKKKGPRQSSNVLYFGHLPREFNEVELHRFLSQFGQILNVRVSRSKRTNGSRGYAFVQFQSTQVADIVADAMSGYLLKGKRKLICHVVPQEQVHPKLFYHRVKPKAPPTPKRTLDRIKTITNRLLSREQQKRNKLKELGIDYDFPGYATSAATAKVAGGVSAITHDAKDASSTTTATTTASGSPTKRKHDTPTSSSSSSSSSKKTKKKVKQRSDSDASIEAAGLPLADAPPKDATTTTPDDSAAKHSTDAAMSSSSKKHKKHKTSHETESTLASTSEGDYVPTTPKASGLDVSTSPHQHDEGDDLVHSDNKHKKQHKHSNKRKDSSASLEDVVLPTSSSTPEASVDSKHRSDSVDSKSSLTRDVDGGSDKKKHKKHKKDKDTKKHSTKDEVKSPPPSLSSKKSKRKDSDASAAMDVVATLTSPTSAQQDDNDDDGADVAGKVPLSESKSSSHKKSDKKKKHKKDKKRRSSAP